MKTKEELYTRLTNICAKNSQNKKKTIEYIKNCSEMYGVPEPVASIYLCGNEEIYYISDDLLYPLSAVLLDKKELKEYFNLDEYKDYKYKEKKISRFIQPIIAVADDQWIGTIMASDLINMYDMGMIRYNANTQRPMKRVVRGEQEFYRFYKNERAVEEMVESLLNNRYIPNTITLNVIHSGIESDISDYYNEGEQRLNISKIDHFDMLDGYHRFLALRRATILMNGRFDIIMELRIVNFSQSRAEQFIFQEDQKTQMLKIQSASFDQDNIGNKVTRSLKNVEDLSGLISRNMGVIDEVFLARAINNIYIERKATSKSEQVMMEKQIYADLSKKLSQIIQEDPGLLDKRWERDYIASVVWCCKKYEGDDLLGCINNFYANKGDKKYFINNPIKGAIINTPELNKVWEGR